MDLADFQLDIDMLRSMATNQQPKQQQQQQQQQQNQQQQQQQQQPQHGQPDGVFERMDMLFQEEHPQDLHFMNTNYSSASKKATPVYHTGQQNEYFDQDDILTPLISPAITPSFSYHQELHNGTIGNDVDFSPLSSPAMMPQRDQDYLNQRHQQQHHYQPHHHSNLQQQSYQATSSTLDYPQMSSNQICKQYEQLEKAKMMITRRLSELQKQQKSQGNGANVSSNQAVQHHSSVRSIPPTTFMNSLSEGTMTSQAPHSDGSVFRQPGSLEPVTPASLMNIRQRQNNPSSTFPQQVSAKAALNEMDMSDNLDKIPTPPPPPTSSSSNGFGTATTPSLIATTSSSSSSTSSSSSSASSAAIATPPTSRGKRKAKQQPPEPRTSNTRKARRSSAFNNNSSSNNTDGKHTSSTTSAYHASPRALKPLLISPSLTPDRHHQAHHSHHFSLNAASVSAVQDAEHILATRSNYQNLMEGKAAALGIAFSSQIKSGLEVRRTAHKAAEQKRRDSLKEWFDRLRREVEEGYVKKKSGLTSKVIREQQREKGGDSDQHTQDDDDEGALKPLSKVLLLRYAYEYIAHLKDTLAERDALLLTLAPEEDHKS